MTPPLPQAADREALQLVLQQAEDEGLWFKAETAAEAYLQQELRRLHAAVEGRHVAAQAKAGAPQPAGEAEPPLPSAYMLAKLAMVMPLFQESRDALTAITEGQRIAHGISKTLADRMDIAGMYSLDDWLAGPGSGSD